MKKFKISIFSILMVLAVFTSCTNEEVIVDPQQDTEESESIITTLSRLNEQFDENGNVDQAENPAGNVVFDFVSILYIQSIFHLIQAPQLQQII